MKSIEWMTELRFLFKKIDWLLELDEKVSLSLLITIFTICNVYFYFYFKAYLSEIAPIETLRESFELVTGYLFHTIYIDCGIYFFSVLGVISIAILFFLKYNHKISILSICIKFFIILYLITISLTTNKNEIKNELGRLYFNISVNSGIFKEKKSNKIIFSYGKDVDGIVYYYALNNSEINTIIKHYKNLDIKKFAFLGKNISTIQGKEFLNNYEKLYCIKNIEKNHCRCKPNKCISILKIIKKELP